MPTCADIRLLAAYNAHMNRKLYAAAARLPAEELAAERGAFFGSLLGTMNHLCAADTIWLTRFAAHPVAFTALASLRDGPVPSNLRQSYGDDLATLQASRVRIDGMIDSFAAQLQPADLDAVLVYRNTRGHEYRKHFGTLLLHFFNHQAHHRGQASTLLTQAGVDIGVTDLLEIIPDAD
ncbi:putative damage-inducible protein DinB [Pseudoduganella lurida]|uniref:Putative damage-inducible protein DinB n=1 Tax=Pseudoduganella lurida TaxID=1036180 RepID=A0A562QZ89_9BURK|nr:DinB family protein [Pseudoduganella lurida]TWI61893.1 putative damage-inducible protein DinB [Pseudoduganella lurida]